MKKLICIIALLVTTLGLQGQFRSLWYEASQYYKLGDSTVTVWGDDTLTSPEMVRSIIDWYFNNVTIDSALYADTSGFTMMADSSFYSDTSGYSYKSDSANHSDTSNYAFKADTATFSAQSGYSDTSGFSWFNDSSNWADSALYADTAGYAFPVNNVINVSPSGGEYTSIAEALNSITNSGPTERYEIRVGPGIYIEPNPMVVPSYCIVKGGSLAGALIIAADPNEDLFEMEFFTEIANFSTNGVTHSDKAIVRVDTAADFLIRNIFFANCSNAIIVDNDTASGTILECALFSSTTPIVNGLKVLGGDVTCDFLRVVQQSEVDTVINARNKGSIVTANNIISFSPNVDIGLYIADTAQLAGYGYRISNMETGFVVEGDSVKINVDGLQVIDAQVDGFRNENNGVGSVLNIFNASFRDAGNLNVNGLNPNTTWVGNGFTQLDKEFFAEGAELYAYLLDIKENDEGLSIFGELHVGNPAVPTESAYGSGDSYSNRMLAYMYDGSVYYEVTDSVKEVDDLNITFPNGNVNTALYLASTYSKDGMFLKHPGLKMLIDTAGVANPEVTVTGATTPVTAGGYNYAGFDFNNEPVYVRTDDGYYLFNTQGWYCLDVEAPVAGINYFETDFISTEFEATYTPVEPATGTPTVAYTFQSTTNPFVFEFYNERTSTWVGFNYMMSQADENYTTYAKNVFSLAGNFHHRYDITIDDSIGYVDPMSLGTEYAWIRIRLDAVETDLPYINQVKLHSDHSEKNADGYDEYFGRSRPILELPLDQNQFQAASASPGNQDLWISDQIDVGRIENLFANGATDRIAGVRYLPLNLDTSSPIQLRWSIQTDGAGGGDIGWVVRYAWTSEGDAVYDNAGDAPATAPTQTTITYTVLAPATDVMQTYQVNLDVSDMVTSARDRPGDLLWFSLERPTGDTHAGDVAIIQFTAFYLAHVIGQHY